MQFKKVRAIPPENRYTYRKKVLPLSWTAWISGAMSTVRQSDNERLLRVVQPVNSYNITSCSDGALYWRHLGSALVKVIICFVLTMGIIPNITQY